MKTCGYCGREIQGDYCSFCELMLDKKYVLEGHKRVDHVIERTPDEAAIFLTTAELLTFETVDLLFLLKYARSYRSEVYHLRVISYKAEERKSDQVLEEIQQQSYEEYERATRKVWIIENILKDRMGYYPVKVTDEFLQAYLYRIKQSQKKQMVLKK
jgi:hypothetical protein